MSQEEKKYMTASQTSELATKVLDLIGEHTKEGRDAYHVLVAALSAVCPSTVRFDF